MLRIRACFIAVVLVAGTFYNVSAQTTPATPAQVTTPAPGEAKPSRMKLTIERLKEMRAKWVQNKPKLRACRAEVKSKGLTGDDRWFYMEDCMGKT